MKSKNEPREIPINTDDEVYELDADEISASAADLIGEDQPPARPGVDKKDGPTSADDERAETAGDQSTIDRLQAQVDAVNQEKVALYDQLLRRQAEFENYRRRVERERGENYQRARAEILLEMLPIVDNFERALSSLEKGEGDATALRHGIELIHKQFNDALVKFGLEPVETVGQTFDPHVHEAVTMEPSQKHKDNTVIEEFQRGYKMGDKLLRPARVKVASNPEK